MNYQEEEQTAEADCRADRRHGDPGSENGRGGSFMGTCDQKTLVAGLRPCAASIFPSRFEISLQQLQAKVGFLLGSSLNPLFHAHLVGNLHCLEIQLTYPPGRNRQFAASSASREDRAFSNSDRSSGEQGKGTICRGRRPVCQLDAESADMIFACLSRNRRLQRR